MKRLLKWPDPPLTLGQDVGFTSSAIIILLGLVLILWVNESAYPADHIFPQLVAGIFLTAAGAIFLTVVATYRHNYVREWRLDRLDDEYPISADNNAR
jgi:hypothetical protein